MFCMTKPKTGEERIRAFLHWHKSRPEIQDEDSHQMASDIEAMIQAHQSETELLRKRVEKLRLELDLFMGEVTGCTTEYRVAKAVQNLALAIAADDKASEGGV